MQLRTDWCPNVQVRRLLCSCRPLTLRLGSSLPDLSDHDLLHEKQTKLRLLCRRSMALPVGRGMFSLASAPPQVGCTRFT